MSDPLGEFELLVLLTLRVLGEANAYGGAIQITLSVQARRAVALGTIAKTLRRLEAKGLARSRLGARRPEPGGRRRVHYAMTRDGQEAVNRTLRRIARLVRAVRGSTPRPRRSTGP